MPLSAGDILNGHYRIETEIGRGAFGRVYRARDTKLDRPVAIKELLKGDADLASAGFDDYALRFEREARIQAGFNHPNIVHVYELIQEGADRLYLVMELVEGESLRDHLARRGPLPIAEATRITAELLTGLAAVHADPRDLVHRDVKPSNILLTKDGRAKLADFGVAQIGDKSHRTHDGKLHPGTPLYMSPEQETASGYLYPTSDLFSAGCVLFEMLTGVAYKHAKKERKDLRGLRPDTPQWLVEVTARALETAPGDRLATAAEMARLLREAKPPPEKPEALEARRTAEKARAEEAERARLAAELQKQAEAARQQLDALQRQTEAEKAKSARREAELAQKEADLARSKQQAQREEAERARRELAERVAQRRRLVLGGIIGIPLLILLLAIWRPWIAGPDNPTPTPTTTAILTPTNGPAAPRTVIAGVTPPEFTPTPSPTPTFTGTPSPTPTPTPTPSPTPAPTDTPSPTATRTATPTRTRTPTPRPSPAFTGTPAPSPQAVIVPENAAQLEELARWNIGGLVAVSPDWRLFAVATAGTVTCYDPATLAQVYSVTVDAAISALAFSPDGTTMALGAGPAVRIWRMGDATARRVQAEQGIIYDVEFSPDGQMVASLGGNQVYLWNVADGMLIRFLGNGLDDRYSRDFAFSPDGSTLVVTGYPHSSIWRVADGSLVRELESNSYNGVFSHDGQTIAASTGGGIGIGLWRVSDGSLIAALTESSAAWGAAFSPDDQIVVFSSYDNSLCAVRLVRMSDHIVLRTLSLKSQLECARKLMFSPDGKTLLMVGSGATLFWGIPTQ